MMRPKTLHAVTDEQVYDAVVAELSDEMSEIDAATHAHNVVARLKEPKVERVSDVTGVERVSDITGFPEDDDCNHYGRGGITRAAREMQKSSRRAERTMQKIPRIPGGGFRR